MITFLFVLLCMVVVWIVFDTIYSLIVCKYFHTKLKYRLFSLRDRLRTIRIEHPALDDTVFRMMELRINGCIGLVREVTVLRLVIAIFFKPFLVDEKESAVQMQKAVQWITDNRETDIGKQLFDIERQSMAAFYESLAYNSLLVTFLFRYIIRPIAHFRPRIVEKYKRIKDDFMQETAPAMMVHAAAPPVAFFIAVLPGKA
jgi:hypothetical protein